MRREAGDVVRRVARCLDLAQERAEVLAMAPAELAGVGREDLHRAGGLMQPAQLHVRLRARRIVDRVVQAPAHDRPPEVVEHDLARAVVARDGDERRLPA